MEANDKTQQHPKWITGDYFKEILAKDEPNCVRVTNCSVERAIPPGENFASVLLRIHLDLEMNDDEKPKHKTYILKTMLDDDKGGNAIRKCGIFPKEMKMYETYLPAFEAMYAAVGWKIQLAPQCLFSENSEERSNIVFEDLGFKDFKSVNRLYGMDMDHMKRTMQKLAELHAVSAVYESKHGPFPDEFRKGFVSGGPSDESHKEMYDSKMTAVKTAMSMWGWEEAHIYTNKFPTYEQYHKCAHRSLNTKDNVFNVLTHGDFWSSNVMQNYRDNGEIDEMLLIDYQFCKWGSPAEDLLFIITLSAANDIRFTEYEHFIQLYHEHLVKCLKVLNYKNEMPKLRELQMDMYREQPEYHAFFALFHHLPVVLAPRDTDMSKIMSHTKEGDELLLGILTNPLYVEAMKVALPFYWRRGLFDFADLDQNGS